MPQNLRSLETTPALRRFTVAREQVGTRLDRFLADQLPELSRTRIQELIDEGRVHVNGAIARRAHRVSARDIVEIEVRPRPLLRATPEAIPLEILHEDEDIIVVNKPAGMAVHAGAGQAGGTVVNALLHRYGTLSTVGGELRPGIVHRLDKLTSGALVVARHDAAHRHLADQFRARSVEKTYLVLVHGGVRSEQGRIDLPVARDLKRRTRMAVPRIRHKGRAARTDWRVRLRLDGFTLLEARLHTGRTHQIRVHFSALGHPVVGDALYGAPRLVRAGRETLPPLGRNFLHAARISFVHPRSRQVLAVRAPLPTDLVAYLRRLAAALGSDPGRIDAALAKFL